MNDSQIESLRDLLHMADESIADYDELASEESGSGRPHPSHLRNQATMRCLYVIAESLVILADEASS